MGKKDPATPDERQVSNLAWWINCFRALPPNFDPFSADDENRHKLEMEKRRTLEAAAKILECDLRRLRAEPLDLPEQSFQWRSGRINAIEAAIFTLRGARSELEIAFSKRERNFRGPKPEISTMIAGRLAVETLLALRKAGLKQRTFGHQDGPIIRFVEQELALILPKTEVPKRSTILDKIKKSEYWRELIDELAQIEVQ